MNDGTGSNPVLPLFCCRSHPWTRAQCSASLVVSPSQLQPSCWSGQRNPSHSSRPWLPGAARQLRSCIGPPGKCLSTQIGSFGSLKTRGDTASQNRNSLSAVATTGPRAGPIGLSASGSAMGSTFPSATRPCVGGSRAMPSSASSAAQPGPGCSCIATLVRMSMMRLTSTVAPIAVCPRRSCTELDTSRTAPVAATPGTRHQSRGIALTLKRPSKPWLASPSLAHLRLE